LTAGTAFSSTWAVSRIAPDAGAALFHCEGAEPTQLHAVAASQSGGDLVEYRRNDQFSVHLSQMRAAGDEFRDEFCPGQRRRGVNSRALHTASAVLTDRCRLAKFRQPVC
jgi:hypothetical protein